MFEAQRLWKDHWGPFQDTFRYQYVLSRETESLEGFQHYRGRDWNLYAGPELPMVGLQDQGGRTIGAVIGIAVGPDVLLTGPVVTLPLDTESTDFWDAFETYIIDVAGRFAFMMEHAGETRFYTDPVGMIGAVHSKKDGHVAASPLMAIKRPLEPNPKFDFDVIANKGGKLALFHTADAHVRRLKPNHYLNLDTFEEHRFWPRDEVFAADGDKVLNIYDEISQRARFNIGQIANAFPCAMPVSGGQDSRLLMAFAGEHTSSIQQFYTHINNYATRRDDAIGRALCNAIDIPHDTHDKRQFRLLRWELKHSHEKYKLTLGAPSSLPKEYINGVVKGVPDGHVILRGHQTDLLRAVFVFQPKERWQDPDWQLERLIIVPRHEFNEEIAAKFRDEFMAWQRTLPENAMSKAADFMFLEVYYNSTVGATFAALWRHFYVSPFNSRRLIALSLSFDEAQRRKSEPVFDIIERERPELSLVPYDFELPASLSSIEDTRLCNEITRKRRRQTRRRLSRYAQQSVPQ
ncbi:hypothetical protein [Marivita geojedonensis]|uniref:Asparagine synthetase domain-containing protein n=1 Tax=Marivita geojedonensis TaxID=1123756 RepID=A0A1X4NPG5_9RHOB|nr:hypothetical protein [Marivita geojedonensis]OSQ52601.1 hypothetical protein MGEO_04325 [Marivita geojedonensis]PRY80798.1 hypothetical protein CLV76_103163 [Marivita geojedonensis]